MKRIILFTLILFSAFILKAQQLTFSDSAVVSMITCSPGEEVYEKFGHSAIRIKDTRKGIDVVFNYGIFSFETENFYYKFIKGETDYQLGVYDTGNFLASYAQRKSLVWEQIINLNPTEKKNIIKNLLKNYEPENRVYRYNFIFDNCATRPKDKVLGAINGYVKFEVNTEAKTYRQWIGAYVGNDTWLKFGIDLLFGVDADKPASLNESMFLPEELMNGFQNAQIHSPIDQSRRLVLDKKILIDKVGIGETNNQWSLKPFDFTLVLLLLGFALTILDYFRHHHTKLFDSVLLITTGLGGVLIFYMMLFSTHPLVKSNLNILWMNPLNLILGIVMWFPKLRIPVFFYEILNILLLIGGLFSFAISAQVFNLAAFPLIVLLVLRSTSWFIYLKKRMYKRRSVI